MATVITNSYCNRTNLALFYPPWQNGASAAAGGVDEEVMWIPPFGANTTIVSLQIFMEVAVGSTTVTIRSLNESILATSVINIADADLVYEAEFNYALSDSVAIIFGLDPTITPQSVRIQVISEETIPA